jgi:hypothetical protein
MHGDKKERRRGRRRERKSLDALESKAFHSARNDASPFGRLIDI